MILRTLALIAFCVAILAGTEIHAETGHQAAATAVAVELTDNEHLTAESEASERRAEADLQAQIGMRQAADELAKLTRWQMWIGGAGLVLLLGTLIANFDAARSARRAIEDLERPYLFLTGHEVHSQVRATYPPGGGRDQMIVTGRTIFARLYLRNLGRAPCTLRSAQISWLQSKQIGPASHGKPPQIENRVLRLEAEEPSLLTLDTQTAWTKDSYDAWRSNSESIFVFVSVTYDDVFGTTYVKHNCFKHDAPHQVIEYGGPKHNFEVRLRRRSLGSLLRKAHKPPFELVEDNPTL